VLSCESRAIRTALGAAVLSLCLSLLVALSGNGGGQRTSIVQIPTKDGPHSDFDQPQSPIFIVDTSGSDATLNDTVADVQAKLAEVTQLPSYLDVHAADVLWVLHLGEDDTPMLLGESTFLVHMAAETNLWMVYYRVDGLSVLPAESWVTPDPVLGVSRDRSRLTPMRTVCAPASTIGGVCGLLFDKHGASRMMDAETSGYFRLRLRWTVPLCETAEGVASCPPGLWLTRRQHSFHLEAHFAPNGARTVWPVLDEPRVRAAVTLRVAVADSARYGQDRMRSYRAASNARLVGLAKDQPVPVALANLTGTWNVGADAPPVKSFLSRYLATDLLYTYTFAPSVTLAPFQVGLVIGYDIVCLEERSLRRSKKVSEIVAKQRFNELWENGAADNDEWIEMSPEERAQAEALARAQVEEELPPLHVGYYGDLADEDELYDEARNDYEDYYDGGVGSRLGMEEAMFAQEQDAAQFTGVGNDDTDGSDADENESPSRFVTLLRVCVPRTLLAHQQATGELSFAVLKARDAFDHFLRLTRVPLHLPKVDLYVSASASTPNLASPGLALLPAPQVLAHTSYSTYRQRLAAGLGVCHAMCSQWYNGAQSARNWGDAWVSVGLCYYLQHYCAYDVLSTIVQAHAGKGIQVWPAFQQSVRARVLRTDVATLVRPLDSYDGFLLTSKHARKTAALLRMWHASLVLREHFMPGVVVSAGRHAANRTTVTADDLLEPIAQLASMVHLSDHLRAWLGTPTSVRLDCPRSVAQTTAVNETTLRYLSVRCEQVIQQGDAPLWLPLLVLTRSDQKREFVVSSQVLAFNSPSPFLIINSGAQSLVRVRYNNEVLSNISEAVLRHGVMIKYRQEQPEQQGGSIEGNVPMADNPYGDEDYEPNLVVLPTPPPSPPTPAPTINYMPNVDVEGYFPLEPEDYIALLDDLDDAGADDAEAILGARELVKALVYGPGTDIAHVLEVVVRLVDKWHRFAGTADSKALALTVLQSVVQQVEQREDVEESWSTLMEAALPLAVQYGVESARTKAIDCFERPKTCSRGGGDGGGDAVRRQSDEAPMSVAAAASALLPTMEVGVLIGAALAAEDRNKFHADLWTMLLQGKMSMPQRLRFLTVLAATGPSVQSRQALHAFNDTTVVPTSAVLPYLQLLLEVVNVADDVLTLLRDGALGTRLSRSERLDVVEVLALQSTSRPAVQAACVALGLELSSDCVPALDVARRNARWAAHASSL